jgi:hypothetical protein
MKEVRGILPSSKNAKSNHYMYPKKYSDVKRVTYISSSGYYKIRHFVIYEYRGHVVFTILKLKGYHCQGLYLYGYEGRHKDRMEKNFGGKKSWIRSAAGR